MLPIAFSETIPTFAIQYSNKSVVRYVKNIFYICRVKQLTYIFMKVFSHCPLKSAMDK